MICLLLAWIGFAAIAQPASAQTPTAEQLQMLRDLSPAQRAALLEALGEQETRRQEPLSEPTVVMPRRATPVESTEDKRDEQGDEQPEGPQPLAPFGYDLFAGEPSTFAPATDIPIPVDYIVGPGDTIEIQLFGSQNQLYSLVVTREGLLNVPELGPIAVAGLRFTELQDTLQQRVGEQLIGVRASISMGRLRSIRVFILGDAYRPGSYTVSSLSTMTNALFVSGGINTIGSLRNVQLKRGGQLVATLDLYDLLLRGDTSGDARLQPGDVIFIPPVGKTVGVAGEVRRPAIYELNGERTVAEVVTIAGGLLPTAFPRASQIERINPDRQRTIIDVDLSSANGLAAEVADDDVLRIFSVLEKQEDIVVLSGHVHRTGPYQWMPGMRMADLLPSLDYLQAGADPGYVLVRREVPGTMTIEAISSDLGAAIRDPASSENIALQPRDSVTVFELSLNRRELINPIIEELRNQSSRDQPTRIVSITGRVKTPGDFPLENQMRVSDLIRAGGGLSEAAYALEAELTRFSVSAGEIRQTELIRVDIGRILGGDTSADITLASYDVLNVKEIPQWRDLESVTIQGEVRFPGSYPIRRGERLSSVIARAGGLTDIAFADGAVFLREQLRRREQDQLEELSQRLESEATIAAAAETDDVDAVAARQALLDQLDETVATGRLVIDLPAILAASGDAAADVALEHGDQLLIPQRSQTVTIIGEVQFPTSHVYRPVLSRDDYIDLSGGLGQNADKKRIYVVRANGSVVASKGSAFFRRRGQHDVYPGDTIVVPIDSDQIRQLTLWTNVSTIVYNIGVAAAAVASF